MRAAGVFLVGDDPYTGKNFDHRRQWVVDSLRRLCGIFAIDCCAYAVMSNHMHLVLRIALQRAEDWSDLEVLERAAKLHPMVGGPALHAYDNDPEDAKALVVVAAYRERLSSLSWFMRQLTEGSVRVASYLTELPPRELLERKLLESIEHARVRALAGERLSLPDTDG